MSNVPDYFKATNEAYSILSDYTGKYPEIDIYSILSKKTNVKVYTYAHYAAKLSITLLEFLKIAPSSYGFSIYNKETHRWLVFYNELKDDTTIRFTLAHELGHIVLGHTVDDEPSKSEANCFARNILCPLPIRDTFHLEKISDYCSCFNISEPMAKATIDHTPSDAYYLTKEYYNRVDENIYCYFTGCTLAELYGYA